MTYEERYTFSSLMTVLIESERKLGELYEIASSEADDAKVKFLLSDSEKNSSTRIEKMQRARVESVVEMALEPLSGLELGELLTRIRATLQSDRMSNLEKVTNLERALSELYARASPKVAQISADTSELLMALSRESMERLCELEHYVTLA